MAAAAASSAALSVDAVVGKLFLDGIHAAFPAVALPDILITQGKKFADLQCNNSMALAKALGQLTPPIKKTPKEVGDEIIKNLPANDVLASAETTPQGFITINVKREWAAAAMRTIVENGVQAPVVPKRKVLVDFSSPNIAKEMHVGHLRSTIIGDCLARVFEFLGHDVARINHVGDWGTQFGMLILYLKRNYPDWLVSAPAISDLVEFYRAAKKVFDEDPEFKEQARLEVVKLQSGDADSLKAWHMLCDVSRVEFQDIYNRLGVVLNERGESYYNDLIPPVIEETTKAGLVDDSEGAKIIHSTQEIAPDALSDKDFGRLMSNLIVVAKNGTYTFEPVLLSVLKRVGLMTTNDKGEEVIQVSKKENKTIAKWDTMKDTDKLAAMMAPLVLKPTLDADLLAFFQTKGIVTAAGKVKVPRFPIPLMVRKSDGGYTYDSTDLAGIYHRLKIENVDRIVYVTDVGQFDHFKMVAQVAEDMGWFAGGKSWCHAGFGLVTGVDGKKLKTRAGDTVKLKDLLDEGVDRAKVGLEEREKGDVAQGHTPEEIAALAKTIGYGAIKYFDLKQNRVSDYGFSFEKVLDFSGNTAVFLLYSYARIRSIQRKAGVEDAKALLATTEIKFETDTEKALALATLRFGPVVLKTAEDISPKNICDFVYDLVGCVSDFYKDCRVLGTEYQNSRLLLLEAVRLTIKQAMNLLGIEVAERL